MTGNHIWGVPPAHVAVRSRNIDSVRAFLEAGLDLSLQDNSGSTVLHHAMYSGKKMLKYLLEEGGARFINIQNVGGFTALHWAVEADMGEEIVRLLLENGTDMELQVHVFGGASTAFCSGELLLTNVLLEHVENRKRVNMRYRAKEGPSDSHELN
jgi:ankyrin repeat protein